MGTLGGWSKRQKLTIDHTQVDDELTDFPVKVIVSSDNPLFDTAKSDGSDVRFTAADGETLLKFEREVHDTNESIAVYHVKIPWVSDTDDTDYYLYYGNADASDASTPNDVWDSNYELVLHMGSSLEDSTSNGNDGTNYGTTLGLASDGYYRSFDGVDDKVPINWLSGDIINTFTMETWVYPKRTIDIFSQSNSGVPNGTSYAKNLMISESHGGDLKAGAGLSIGTNGIAVIEHGSSYYPQVLSHSTSFSGWTHIAIIYNNRIPSLYINGQFIKTGLTSGRSTVYPGICPSYSGELEGLGFGHYGYFNGLITEVRISSTARSDAWIKATSASLCNELLTFGDEEPAVTMMLAFNF